MSPRSHVRRATPARTSAPWAVGCWIAVLLLIGVVQILRAQWIDTAVFFGAAVLVLVADRFPSAARARPSVRALILAAVPMGLALCLLPRHGIGMVCTVAAIGTAAVASTWQGRTAPRRPWTPTLRRLAWAWAGIVVAGCLWELAQFILGRIHPADPSFALSDLIDPMLDASPGRILFVVLWLAVGIFLLRRGGRS